MAYVHKRCMEGTFEDVQVDHLPDSQTELYILLEHLKEKKMGGDHYLPLSEYFRTCNKKSLTLSFKEIGEIWGEELGLTAHTEDFWYRDDGNSICNCWKDYGWEIKRLHLDGRPRVTFGRTALNHNDSKANLPEYLYRPMPQNAKYELENFYKYIREKYGL